MSMDEMLKGLQAGAASWNQIAVAEPHPFPTRLFRLAYQLRELDSLIDLPWPEDAAGAAQDHHARLYTGILVYLAYWLAPSRSGVRDLPNSDEVQSLVEQALQRWAEALRDEGAYLPSFRERLQLHLGGPFVAPLASVLLDYDPQLLRSFLAAVSGRIRSLSRGHASPTALPSYIADVAAGFWTEVVDTYWQHARATSDDGAYDQIAELAQEVLPAVFQAVRLEDPAWLPVFDRVLRPFRLLPAPGNHELRERLAPTLAELEAIVNTWRHASDRLLVDHFKRAMSVIRPAITGVVRQCKRQYLGERQIHPHETAQLRIRRQPAKVVPCRLIDICQDFSGVGLSVDLPPHSFTQDGRTVKFRFPGDVVADLKDCEVKIPFVEITNQGRQLRWLTLLDLELCWVRQFAASQTRLGCRILGVDGDLRKFCEYLAWSFDLYLTPQERFLEH